MIAVDCSISLTKEFDKMIADIGAIWAIWGIATTN
jgi:hypothetical protein